MAISKSHHTIVRNLFENGVLPQNGALLELGEANWYDPNSAHLLADEIRKFVPDPARRDELLARLAQLVETREENVYLYHVAKIFYEVFFSPSEVQAIDFHGTPIAQKLDLNDPVTLDRRFDVTINHGTAEHIFNIAQVFRTIHEYTVPGGLMIHESPFTGWVEHGFYTLQPTLFQDVAEYNRYSIVCMVIEDLHDFLLPIHTREDVYEFVKEGKLPENSVLFTAMKKDTVDRPFSIPTQAAYRSALSPKGVDAWRELR
jgi:hypothetical protein